MTPAVTEAQPHILPPPPDWFVWRMQQCGYVNPEDPGRTVKFYRGQNLVWESNPGPQTWALHCHYDEILLGGSRGGGKSAGLIAWMAMGDPMLPQDDPARASFLMDPSFRGLLLREEYQSMAEFVEEAVEFYRNFGGKPTGNPVTVDFSAKGSKHGAKIYFNHLGDEEAYNKYRGWNLTKIGLEELTRIETLRRYLKLLGSLRSVVRQRTVAENGKAVQKTFPKLRTQLMATTNPDGPGAIFVKNRFVRVYAGGKPVPWNTRMTDPITKLSRIFIPARLKDNPYLRDDTKYMGMLLSQDEVTQRQWIDGDWEAGIGLFFLTFRPDGPIGQEEADKYPWAKHVIRAPYPDLKPWWYRWGSCDWGFDHYSAFHKACRNEHDKRIHVYDEMQVRQVGSYELGVLLAKWWLPELESLPDHQITVYLSPDAFSKTDEQRTKAEQIAAGIQEVLGPYGALLLRYTSEERAAASRDPKFADALFQFRQREVEGKMCIILKPANRDRVAGWSYITELLRWKPVRTETEAEIKERLTKMFSTRGVEAYEREIAIYREQGAEILPKIQIWSTCPEVIRCLKEAQRDDAPKNEDVRKFDALDGVGGDDALDDFRYLTIAHKDIAVAMPKAYWTAERATEVLARHEKAFGEPLTDPTRLAMVAMRQAALYEKNNIPAGGSFNFPRQGSQRHRRLQ